MVNQEGYSGRVIERTEGRVIRRGPPKVTVYPALEQLGEKVKRTKAKSEARSLRRLNYPRLTSLQDKASAEISRLTKVGAKRFSSVPKAISKTFGLSSGGAKATKKRETGTKRLLMAVGALQSQGQTEVRGPFRGRFHEGWDQGPFERRTPGDPPL